MATTTFAPLCGAGVDLRYDTVGDTWLGADDVHRIECPECRRMVERRAA
jgi:hypothetical protein